MKPGPVGCLVQLAMDEQSGVSHFPYEVGVPFLGGGISVFNGASR